jgi:LytS/YehU family sensor histidine kinase
MLVSNYLAIEEARFDGKLDVTLEMDPALKGLPVPAFAVQTLVENAVKHGIEKRRGGGSIKVLCRTYSDELAEIEVSDTGIGIPALFAPAAEPPHADSFYGLGLRNVSTRLAQLYGREDLLRITSGAGEGTRAILYLPRHHERGSDRPHALHQRSMFTGAVSRAPEEL